MTTILAINFFYFFSYWFIKNISLWYKEIAAFRPVTNSASKSTLKPL